MVIKILFLSLNSPRWAKMGDFQPHFFVFLDESFFNKKKTFRQPKFMGVGAAPPSCRPATMPLFAIGWHKFYDVWLTLITNDFVAKRVFLAEHVIVCVCAACVLSDVHAAGDGEATVSKCTSSD